MTKINQIQQAILSLAPGAYQKLMDCYLMRKFQFPNIHPLGSHDGTDKTTKGTPDSFVQRDDGKFILIAHGTVGTNSYGKVEEDIQKCLDSKLTGIPVDDIAQIICCHTSTNFSPGQTKALCSLFRNTIPIGLGDVSFDLQTKYPDLARDHLGVSIDTHQIFDIDGFISYSAQNPYSVSLDMPLLCRDIEKAAIKNLLAENAVTLITGPSGVGKTRLSIEAAKEFAQENGYCFNIIRSNGEQIYEDLKTSFSEDKDYLILVDDADQLVQLKHLLDFCADPTRQHNFRLLFTVRDYAKANVMMIVRDVFIPVIYDVPTLSNESISEILQKDLKIENTALIEQIQKIAKGNARLAVMAGMCAVNGDFEHIRNSFDLFDNYYSRIMQNLESREILVAALIAFFNSTVLNGTSLPFEIALEYVISSAEFTDTCYKLHQQEVVSIFENKAVRFENQNLRDYLLYYVFFKEKWITPSSMILSAFPAFREQIIYAFNTLIRLFWTEENVAYMEREIKFAWGQIKDADERIAREFMEAFHIVIPDESLAYIKRSIDALPEAHQNLKVVDFDKTKNHHFIGSDLIKMLIGFKETDQFETAIQLALLLFERNSENPMDLYFLFKEKWGVHFKSCESNYERETMLLRQLEAYYNHVGSDVAALSLMFAASGLLQLSYSSCESGDGRAITFLNFVLTPCDALFSLRALALKILFSMLVVDDFHDLAVKLLLEYDSHPQYKDDIVILEHDISQLPVVVPELSTSDFDVCRVINHFEKICIRQEIEWPYRQIRSLDNPVYALFSELRKDNILEFKTWQEAEARRKERINRVAFDISWQVVSELWAVLEIEESKPYITRNHELSSGIDLLFSSLADIDKEKFLLCCDAYCAHQTPFWDGYRGVIQGLLKTLGFSAALGFVKKREFSRQGYWLAEIYNCLPVEAICPDLCDEIIYCLKTEGNGAVRLETVLRIDDMIPGFLVKYIYALNNIGEQYPHTVSNFLWQFSYESEEYLIQTVDRFGEDIGALSQAYLLAAQGHQLYDHDGQLFILLVRKDPAILSTFIQSFYAKQLNRDDVSCLDVLWKQTDYIELATNAFNAMKACNRYRLFDPMAERFLCYSHNEQATNSNKDCWVTDYISQNNKDKESMQFLFDVLCNFPDERLHPAIQQLCRSNTSFEMFDSLSITPSHTSWSGSAVPVLEKRIKSLEKLKELLSGVEYIEHRYKLSQLIQATEERKEQVVLKEFTER